VPFARNWLALIARAAKEPVGVTVGNRRAYYAPWGLPGLGKAGPKSGSLYKGCTTYFPLAPVQRP
jgi:hypothetical protein